MKDAVQITSKALMDIQEIRIDGQPWPVLIPPTPLEPGKPEHEKNGHRLWNPKWLAGKPFTDPYNTRFIDAVVSTTIANAQVRQNYELQSTSIAKTMTYLQAPGVTSKISGDDLNNPKAIKAAAKQYFTTLATKYKENIDVATKEKGQIKVARSHQDGCKKTKQVRQAGAVPTFEAHHAITGIGALVMKDCMLSEDEGPGAVGATMWNEKAKKHSHQGQTVVEVRRVNWREHKVSSQTVMKIDD